MPSTARWRASVVERITIDVPTPPGGWAPPWPNVVEIEAVLPHEKWTLVDVLIADHRAPRVIERLRGRSMVRIEGGTQALKRTVNARLEMAPGHVTTISVPSPFGATVLKAAAYLADSCDRTPHPDGIGRRALGAVWTRQDSRSADGSPPVPSWV